MYDDFFLVYNDFYCMIYFLNEFYFLNQRLQNELSKEKFLL